MMSNILYNLKFIDLHIIINIYICYMIIHFVFKLDHSKIGVIAHKFAVLRGDSQETKSKFKEDSK